MKKITKRAHWRTAIALVMFSALLLAVSSWRPLGVSKVEAAGNFTDEMKIPYKVNMNDMGANSVERKGDHQDSQYFSRVDFYNAHNTGSLLILPRFKTIQQTSWWSCGISSIQMVMEYYGRSGNWNEVTLAKLRTSHEDVHPGTCMNQMIEVLEKAGDFTLETTYDYQDNLETVNLAFIRERLRRGAPIIVGWNDWGGHWQVIIGYDDMGTEYEGDDVIIVADPFDTTDHNQDGYGVYGAERFIYNFTFFDFFNAADHPREKCFIVVQPETRTKTAKRSVSASKQAGVARSAGSTQLND